MEYSILEIDNDFFIIVLPNIPKWFSVDRFGKEVFQEIAENKSLDEITANDDAIVSEEKSIVFREIHELISEAMNIDEVVVHKPLLPATTVAMISLTRNCQLRCGHCYVDARGARDYELTLADHQRLAEEISNYLCPNPDEVNYKVALTGGEPFLHKDILEIIATYRNKNLGVGISTNALLVKREQMGYLAANQVSISVSLDGANEETHEFIRGKNTYFKTLGKIIELRNRGVNVGINTLVHSGNFDQLEKIIDLAFQLGCSGINPINLVQLGRAQESKLERVPEKEVFRRIADYLTVHPEQLRLFRRTSMFSSIGSAVLTGISCRSCGVGERPCVYIDSNGDVYPCANTQRPQFLLGNVLHDSLRYCAERDHPILIELSRLNVNTLNPKCASCDVRKFCGGDCRGETENVTGDITAPYVACEDRRNSIIELMAIATEHPEFFSERVEEFSARAV